MDQIRKQSHVPPKPLPRPAPPILFDEYPCCTGNCNQGDGVCDCGSTIKTTRGGMWLGVAITACSWIAIGCIVMVIRSCVVAP